MTSTLLDLPFEILRAILGAAYCRPSYAFHYPLLDTELHERLIPELVVDSTRTKLALGLVSRLFHELVDEWLYRVIRLQSVRRVTPLSATLSSRYRLANVAQGRWCRRLELGLRLPSSDNAEWNQARATSAVCGIIAACPRLLVDLRVSVVYEVRAHRTFSLSSRLMKIIATRCGGKLRHLQLGGHMSITARGLERMLMATSLLEVCHITGVVCSDTEEEVEEDEGVAGLLVLGNCRHEDENNASGPEEG